MENTKERPDAATEIAPSASDAVQDSRGIGQMIEEKPAADGFLRTAEETREVQETEALKEEAAVAATTRAAATVRAAEPGTAAIPVYLPRRRSKAGLFFYSFFKRAFDIVSSGIMLVLLSPLLAILLLVKWLEDFHNPVYVSERVGKDGKIFKFYKIRTMCPDADTMKEQLIADGKNEADGPAFKMKNDPRITKIGRVYRKLSLDELPQLVSIFTGKMSVVGPRPPLPKEVAQYNDYQMHRLDVKGGLLCLWQIQKNRNELPFDEWVRLDLEYIDNRSLWLDLKIIFKGAYMVIFDRSGE